MSLFAIHLDILKLIINILPPTSLSCIASTSKSMRNLIDEYSLPLLKKNIARIKELINKKKFNKLSLYAAYWGDLILLKYCSKNGSYLWTEAFIQLMKSNPIWRKECALFIISIEKSPNALSLMSLSNKLSKYPIEEISEEYIRPFIIPLIKFKGLDVNPTYKSDLSNEKSIRAIESLSDQNSFSHTLWSRKLQRIKNRNTPPSLPGPEETEMYNALVSGDHHKITELSVCDINMDSIINNLIRRKFSRLPYMYYPNPSYGEIELAIEEGNGLAAIALCSKFRQRSGIYVNYDSPLPLLHMEILLKEKKLRLRRLNKQKNIGKLFSIEALSKNSIILHYGSPSMIKYLKSLMPEVEKIYYSEEALIYQSCLLLYNQYDTGLELIELL